MSANARSISQFWEFYCNNETNPVKFSFFVYNSNTKISVSSLSVESFLVWTSEYMNTFKSKKFSNENFLRKNQIQKFYPSKRMMTIHIWRSQT